LEFRVTAVNPLDHAEEIKQLFVADERPEFVPFFDRAYAAGVQAGGGSWVGCDPDGHIVMHLACFPRRFRFGERDVVGGLMRDALVARPYRSFFPAHALIKRATEDTRARGSMDFVYTNPNRHAKAVMDLCGFAQIGTLERYVLPVGHRRWIVDRPIGLVHAGVRLVRGGATLVPRAASEFSAVEFASPPGDSPRLRPYHNAAQYLARLEGYPAAADWWFTLKENGAGAAGLLVRGPDSSCLADLYAVRRDPRLPLARLISSLAVAVRANRCTRLQVWTLAESLFATEVRRSGFVPRQEAAPLVATALTPNGQAVLHAAHLWEITSLDCDH